MKVLYIDLETTGLDHDRDDVLEIGCVVDDLGTGGTFPLIDKLPFFHCYVVKEWYSGHPFALALNAEILKKIANRHQYSVFQFLKPEEVANKLGRWLSEQFGEERKITVGGKNAAGFDMKFLARLDGFDRQGGGLIVGKYGYASDTPYEFRARVVDPAILYWRPFADDALPSTNECCDRAGIVKQTDHTAIGDCLLVAALVRWYIQREGHNWLLRDLPQ